ncbi:MAG TPA: hypothetical protein VFB74_18225 [Kribbellaceae bacterium]|nr:hypothetical protein [Kribbellaceae bacterium]
MDADFGLAFIKICAYFPYPGKIWFNGHEWAKRQAVKAGLGFRELSNGFASCTDPQALQDICDRLGPGAISVFAERWWARLPLPFTPADRAAGYWWDISIRQVEVAKTIVFTAPRHARGFFEALAADNLDIGRPDSMQIVFNRQVRANSTGVFQTVVDRDNDGVVVNAYYRHSRIKYYVKDRRALRIEAVINDTRDLGVLRRLPNLDELIAKARDVNRRLLDTIRVGQGCVLASPAIERVAQPTLTEDGRRAPALRFGDPRVMALTGALCLNLFTVTGVTNKSLCHDRPAARHQLQSQPDDLRPAPATTQRPDPPHRTHPHLRPDPRRPTTGHLLHQAPRPATQTSRRRRPTPSTPTAASRASHHRPTRRRLHHPSATQTAA